MEGKTYMIAAFLLMNLVGLLLMRADKIRAKKRQNRIQEKTLWLVALFGGAVGTTMGMQLYRHKTKHVLFKIGFPLLAAAEMVLIIWFMKR